MGGADACGPSPWGLRWSSPWGHEPCEGCADIDMRRAEAGMGGGEEGEEEEEGEVERGAVSSEQGPKHHRVVGK